MRYHRTYKTIDISKTNGVFWKLVQKQGCNCKVDWLHYNLQNVSNLLDIKLKGSERKHSLKI